MPTFKESLAKVKQMARHILTQDMIYNLCLSDIVGSTGGKTLLQPQRSKETAKSKTSFFSTDAYTCSYSASIEDVHQTIEELAPDIKCILLKKAESRSATSEEIAVIECYTVGQPQKLLTSVSPTELSSMSGMFLSVGVLAFPKPEI